MPTKLRIDLAGYHHVINRGVNRCNVFNHTNDKDMFLQIINKTALIQKVILHDYVLMDNHYHLLIETQKENLSIFMRIINANYAQYFNRKYNRSGHLWQDRYKSKYVISNNYLYVLIKYIENNPIEAGITQKISTYPHTLSYKIFNNQKLYKCTHESIMIKNFTIKELSEFLEKEVSKEDLKYLEKMQKEKIELTKEKEIIKIEKEIKEYFSKITTRKERNDLIRKAYIDGYTQVEISEEVGLSKSSISKIIKS